MTKPAIFGRLCLLNLRELITRITFQFSVFDPAAFLLDLGQIGWNMWANELVLHCEGDPVSLFIKDHSAFVSKPGRSGNISSGADGSTKG